MSVPTYFIARNLEVEGGALTRGFVSASNSVLYYRVAVPWLVYGLGIFGELLTSELISKILTLSSKFSNWGSQTDSKQELLPSQMLADPKTTIIVRSIIVHFSVQSETYASAQNLCISLSHYPHQMLLKKLIRHASQLDAASHSLT